MNNGKSRSAINLFKNLKSLRILPKLFWIQHFYMYIYCLYKNWQCEGCNAEYCTVQGQRNKNSGHLGFNKKTEIYDPNSDGPDL